MHHHNITSPTSSVQNPTSQRSSDPTSGQRCPLLFLPLVARVPVLPSLPHSNPPITGPLPPGKAPPARTVPGSAAGTALGPDCVGTFARLAFTYRTRLGGLPDLGATPHPVVQPCHRLLHPSSSYSQLAQSSSFPARKLQRSSQLLFAAPFTPSSPLSSRFLAARSRHHLTLRFKFPPEYFFCRCRLPTTLAPIPTPTHP